MSGRIMSPGWRSSARAAGGDALSEKVDAEREAEVPYATAAQAHHQQARSPEPVRHRQVAGVQRAQSDALDEG